MKVLFTLHRPVIYAVTRGFVYTWKKKSSSPPSSHPMKLPLFLTTVAAFTCLPTPPRASCFAAARSVHHREEEVLEGVHAKADTQSCPFYGCPLLPEDVHYNSEDYIKALQEMRSRRRVQGVPDSKVFAGSGREDAATFTLIGYKGGSLAEQINQDRSIVVSPYYISEKENRNPNEQPRILMGVFDGHAPNGEAVSEYTAQELPRILAAKLEQGLANGENKVEVTKKVLHDTFVELDKLVPAEESGGCTATVLLLQDGKVYIANAGDSRTFLVAYRPSTNTTEVLFISREDKPELPEEQERVENMGGQVYIPVRGTSRVVYHDPRSGAPTGLAMSRSIGDWAAGKLGVIPDPKIDVFDIQTLVHAELSGSLQDIGSYIVSEEGEVSSGGDHQIKDDVYIFAVSASDGLMDFLEAEEVAKVMALSMCHKDGAHPITTCEQLIFAAANAWQQSKQGRYRDDITVAVAMLRSPPLEAV